MNTSEFLCKLKEVAGNYNWHINSEGCVRANHKKYLTGLFPEFCPIHVVTYESNLYKSSETLHKIVNGFLWAANEIGLDEYDACDIARAADNRCKSECFGNDIISLEHLREQLTSIVGLNAEQSSK